jgi:hypothetical protein
MKNYECKICNKYYSNHISDIIKHLSRKNICKRSILSSEYSNDQLLILSLLNKNDDINIRNISHLYNSNIINDNKEDFFYNIKYINNNRLKKCNICNNNFIKISDLRNHIILHCYYNKLNNKFLNINNDTSNIISDNSNIINDNIKNNINNSSNIHNNLNNNLNNNSNIIYYNPNNKINNKKINNINNNNIINNITNNITNNINIYFDNKKIIPFDENWNINNIKNLDYLIFSNKMYTELLQQLLNNDINLNVIIDNNKNYGFIYKNDNEKYITMNTDTIINKIIEKLKYHLLEINNNLIEKYVDECIKFSRININKKYNEYINNNDLKENIYLSIRQIYDNKKEDAIKIYKNISNNTIEY